MSFNFGSPNGQSTFRSVVLSLPGFNISLNANLYQNGDTDDYYSVWDPVESTLNFTFNEEKNFNSSITVKRQGLMNPSTPHPSNSSLWQFSVYSSWNSLLVPQSKFVSSDQIGELQIPSKQLKFKRTSIHNLEPMFMEYTFMPTRSFAVGSRIGLILPDFGVKGSVLIGATNNCSKVKFIGEWEQSTTTFYFTVVNTSNSFLPYQNCTLQVPFGLRISTIRRSSSSVWAKYCSSGLSSSCSGNFPVTEELVLGLDNFFAHNTIHFNGLHGAQGHLATGLVYRFSTNMQITKGGTLRLTLPDVSYAYAPVGKDVVINCGTESRSWKLHWATNISSFIFEYVGNLRLEPFSMCTFTVPYGLLQTNASRLLLPYVHLETGSENCFRW